MLMGCDACCRVLASGCGWVSPPHADMDPSSPGATVALPSNLLYSVVERADGSQVYISRREGDGQAWMRLPAEIAGTVYDRLLHTNAYAPDPAAEDTLVLHHKDDSGACLTCRAADCPTFAQAQLVVDLPRSFVYFGTPEDRDQLRAEYPGIFPSDTDVFRLEGWAYDIEAAIQQMVENDAYFANPSPAPSVSSSAHGASPPEAPPPAPPAVPPSVSPVAPPSAAPAPVWSADAAAPVVWGPYGTMVPRPTYYGGWSPATSSSGAASFHTPYPTLVDPRMDAMLTAITALTHRMDALQVPPTAAAATPVVAPAAPSPASVAAPSVVGPSPAAAPLAAAAVSTPVPAFVASATPVLPAVTGPAPPPTATVSAVTSLSGAPVASPADVAPLVTSSAVTAVMPAVAAAEPVLAPPASASIVPSCAAAPSSGAVDVVSDRGRCPSARPLLTRRRLPRWRALPPVGLCRPFLRRPPL